MPQQDALQSTLIEIGLAIAPLRSVDTPARAAVFFKQLGYDLPGSAFGGSLSALATQAGEIVTCVKGLIDANGAGAVAGALVNLVTRVKAAIDAIKQLQTALQAGPPVQGLDQLPQRLLNFLLLDYASRRKPELHAALHVLGLIEHEPSAPAAAPQRVVNWDRIGRIFTAPASIAQDAYQWDSGFDSSKLLDRLLALMRAAALPGGLYPQSATTQGLLGNAPGQQELRFPLLQKGFTSAAYSQFGVTLSPADAQPGKKKGMAVLPYLMGAVNFDFDVCDRGELVFTSSADIKGVGLVVRPPFDAEGILNLTAAYQASLAIREKPDHADELIIIGTASGTRLSMQGLGFKSHVGNSGQGLDIGVEAEVGALRLVIKGGDGDGFLQQVLSGVDVEAQAAMALGFSLLQGFTFRGGAALAIEFPTHIDIGPVRIDSLRLELGPAADKFKLDAGAVIKLALGPMQAVVEGIGISADLKFVAGNLGPVDLSVGFKPPKGIGLSIDAGAIRGGGYLFIDPDKGEYAGALELTFAEFLSLKAIGIITTKMPDGSNGFSLLVIITAEFGATGLQLGYGFTLLGVGGLVGLNRTVKLEALIAGVRNGAVNNIMFPRDIIANAARIISDLRTIFPPRNGTFLIGPMAKIGWGTPTLVSISLGVIIEIPGNIAILGVLRVALPAELAPLIVLQVSFVGAIEFDRKRIYFFATLFDSRVLFITIDGDMGLLAAFGDDANFVLSIGGFHPRFTPPPLPFPVPTRISISVLNESWGRVRAEGYFAVTSNTVQFGARAEAYFGFDAISVEGGMSLDALIQFSPFHFVVDFSSHWSVKVFGAGVFGVSVQLMLEGPAPWRAKGRGTVTLLFFDISADFDITWGDEGPAPLPPVNVLPLLVAEYDKKENWRAFLKGGRQELVTLRKLDTAADALVLHPSGVLRILQKAVPLDITISKVGNSKASDGKKFQLSAVSAGFSMVGDVKEKFASAQFNDLTDQARLAAPAFESENGGIDLAPGGGALFSATVVKRTNRYELITIDTRARRSTKGLYVLKAALSVRLLSGSAVAKSSLSAHNALQKNPFADKVAATAEGFAVAFSDSNTAMAAASFASEASAREFLGAQIRNDPALAGQIHVIPTYELAA